MTKKYSKGSHNQNSPRAEAEFAGEFVSGDNSKGNKHNRTQKGKK